MIGDDEELSAGEAAFFTSGGQAEPEAAPEPEVETEETEAPDLEETQEPEATQDKQDDGRKVKTVPHQALHAERVKRQELEKTLTAEREKLARLDERIRLINEAIAQQNAPKPTAPPDPEQDPVGALRHQQEQLLNFQKQQQEAEARRQQDEQLSSIDNAYKRSWAEFTRSTPDGLDAYNHFTTALDSYFQARGVTDQQQREQLVMQEERQIAAVALQQGKSAAQIVYEQAKAMGYAPKAAETPAVDKITARQKAMPAARSMSNTGGAAKGELTPETLANMDEDDFAEVMSKLGNRKMASILGG